MKRLTRSHRSFIFGSSRLQVACNQLENVNELTVRLHKCAWLSQRATFLDDLYLGTEGSFEAIRQVEKSNSM